MQSKTNLELKHHCSNFNKVRTVLNEIGAKKEIIKKQKDFFFNIAENRQTSPRLKLRIENGEQWLIYYERPHFVKGKETASRIKLHKIKDGFLLQFLKDSLGVKGIVEKIREVWRKENTVFYLDKVKGVGNLFEVELQKNGKITQKDKAVFKSYQDKLLPVLEKVISGSNIDLVLSAKS